MKSGRGRKYFLSETKAFVCFKLFLGEAMAIARGPMAGGIIKGLIRLLLSFGAALVGIMLLWGLLQVPGEILRCPSETASLASPLEIMAIAYIVLWNLKRYKLGIGEGSFKMVSTALKASVVFYATGLVAIVLGYARYCSLAGFIAAATYSLKGNLASNPYLSLPQIPRPSSAVTIPVPSRSGLPELPIDLCTPPDEGTMTAYNVHLGREARAWIRFSRRRPHLRSRSFDLHVEKVRQILGSKTRSVGSFDSPRGVEDHLSKRIGRGYLLDPSKSVAEALEALSKVGRRGVEVSLQFSWTREKGGVSARHLVAASSNDLQAFSRFEADLINRIPFTSFIEAQLAVDLMTDIRREGFLKPVGEDYLKYVLPMGISYDTTYLLDAVTLRNYMGKRGRSEGTLSFQFPEGHALIIGDRSSGKTRFAKSLVSALAEMNAIVIVIDPHGEYHVQGHRGDKLYLNPFKPPIGVDALTHSGSLLVFSRNLASAFSVEEPQDEVAKMTKSKEPLLGNYLADIAGKVDRETARVRDAVSKLAVETGIDEAIMEIAAPDHMQSVITVEVPVHRKGTANLLTELFIAWAASLATSRRTVRVVMIIEDADEVLDVGEASNLLEYAEDYGLSLVLISRSCAPFVQSGQSFSIIAGFRMSRKEDAGAFRKLIGLGEGEPEGMQIEAAISRLHSGDSILFVRNSFDFILARARGNMEA